MRIQGEDESRMDGEWGLCIGAGRLQKAIAFG